MQFNGEVKTLIKALVKCQAEVLPAIKGSVNPAFRSKYADLAAVMEASKESLTNNGLAISFGFTDEEGGIRVTPVVFHESGESLMFSPGLLMPLERKTAHAIGSAITYAKRYHYQAILGIPSEDDDGNAASERSAAPTPKKHPEAPPDPVQEAAEVFEADPYQVARDRVVKDIQALVGKPGEKDAWPEAEKSSLKLKELITEASQTKNADLLVVALERAKAFARLRTQGNNDATIKAILACPDVTRLAELGVV